MTWLVCGSDTINERVPTPRSKRPETWVQFGEMDEPTTIYFQNHGRIAYFNNLDDETTSLAHLSHVSEGNFSNETFWLLNYFVAIYVEPILTLPTFCILCIRITRSFLALSADVAFLDELQRLMPILSWHTKEMTGDTGSKQDANSGLLDELMCVWRCPWPPGTSALSRLGKYLWHPLFKSSETEADRFTMQVLQTLKHKNFPWTPGWEVMVCDKHQYLMSEGWK